MNTKRFRVALVQYHASGQSIGENTEKACEFIRQAAAEQADMVLFTECFLTTYQFPAICETLPPLGGKLRRASLLCGLAGRGDYGRGSASGKKSALWPASFRSGW